MLVVSGVNGDYGLYEKLSKNHHHTVFQRRVRTVWALIRWSPNRTCIVKTGFIVYITIALSWSRKLRFSTTTISQTFAAQNECSHSWVYHAQC